MQNLNVRYSALRASPANQPTQLVLLTINSPITLRSVPALFMIKTSALTAALAEILLSNAVALI